MQNITQLNFKHSKKGVLLVKVIYIPQMTSDLCAERAGVALQATVNDLVALARNMTIGTGCSLLHSRF